MPMHRDFVGKDLKHKTMSAAAAEQLRQRILGGAYPAGTALRQDALAAEFGISRIPVREALMQLEAEGLVKIVPHKGAIVFELSLAEVEELFELRALIEPILLERSAPHLTEADFVELREIIAAFTTAGTARHVNRWGELNAEFHMVLYRHANRPRSLSLVMNLLQECDRHTRIQLSLEGAMARAQQEHAEMVNLCEAGRFDEASSLMRRHILHVGESLRHRRVGPGPEASG
ncbi:GntR family transcriptional regulator [Mesorhizobium sp. A556]